MGTFLAIAFEVSLNFMFIMLTIPKDKGIICRYRCGILPTHSCWEALKSDRRSYQQIFWGILYYSIVIILNWLILQQCNTAGSRTDYSHAKYSRRIAYYLLMSDETGAVVNSFLDEIYHRPDLPAVSPKTYLFSAWLPDIFLQIQFYLSEREVPELL